MNKPKVRTLKTVTPPEFDRNKYDVLKGQSAYVWESVLSKRSYLNGQLDKEIRTTGVSDKLKAEVLAMLENPAPGEQELAEGNYCCDHEDFMKEADGIRYLVMYDMLRVADDKYRYGPAIDAYRRNGGASDDELLRKPVYLAGKNTELTPVLVEVIIDMSAQNAILIREFKLWLELTRASIATAQSNPIKRRRSTPLTQKFFAALINNGVVQYIDLALWAKAFSVRLTAPQYAKAIFHDEDLKRRISRLKSRDAPEVLDRSFLEMLHGQARSEMVRPKPKPKRKPKHDDR
jgi:hypothetical protein